MAQGLQDRDERASSLRGKQNACHKAAPWWKRPRRAQTVTPSPPDPWPLTCVQSGWLRAHMSSQSAHSSNRNVAFSHLEATETAKLDGPTTAATCQHWHPHCARPRPAKPMWMARSVPPKPPPLSTPTGPAPSPPSGSQPSSSSDGVTGVPFSPCTAPPAALRPCPPLLKPVLGVRREKSKRFRDSKVSAAPNVTDSPAFLPPPPREPSPGPPQPPHHQQPLLPKTLPAPCPQLPHCPPPSFPVADATPMGRFSNHEL